MRATGITWGSYLTNQVPQQSDTIFKYSDSYDPILSWSLCNRLRTHGYAILAFDESNFSLKSFQDWENVFHDVFDLANEDKNELLQYCTTKGVTVGYRNENNREFIETRACSNKRTLPVIHVNRFDDIVHEMYTRLSVASQQILGCICEYLGINEDYLVNLVDRGVVTDDEISSSVIRICKYPASDANNENSPKIVTFGAHTDTSFLTLAPCSSVAGE